MVIIEAKAQQGYKMEQLNDLIQARTLIKRSTYPYKNVMLVGLVSSKYSPSDKVKAILHRILTWSTVAQIYPEHVDIYRRANEVYGN